MADIASQSVGAATGQAPQLRLEKPKSAWDRMSISRTQFYREVKAGRLRVVRTGKYSTAVLSSDVDDWIMRRVLGGEA